MQPGDVSVTSSSCRSRHNTSSTWGDHSCQDRDRISKIVLHHVGYTKIPTHVVQYFMDRPHCNISQAGVKELGVPRESNPGAWRHVGSTALNDISYHGDHGADDQHHKHTSSSSVITGFQGSQRITHCRPQIRVSDGPHMFIPDEVPAWYVICEALAC